MCNVNAAIGLLSSDGKWSAPSLEGSSRIVVAQPVEDITHYLKNFTGKDYDPMFALENATSPNNFTNVSLEAIKGLKVHATPRFKEWLLSPDGQKSTGELLAEIPNDDLGSISDDDFKKLLASSNRSPTSKLWNLLYNKLVEFNQPARQGRQVVASKLIHGKRPKLVPITDSFVRIELVMNWATSWTCSYKIMKDPSVVALCKEVRDAVVANGPYPAGVDPAGLSDVRILDLAVWCFHRRRL